MIVDQIGEGVKDAGSFRRDDRISESIEAGGHDAECCASRAGPHRVPVVRRLARSGVDIVWFRLHAAVGEVEVSTTPPSRQGGR